MNDQGTCDDELRRAWAAANAADTAESTPAARSLGPADRDKNAWRAPFWATVLAVLIVPVALMFGGLAPMATDSCGPDHCSPHLNQALADIVYGLYATLIGTPTLLLTAWALPRRMRYAMARRLTAWCALLPPVTVILLTGSLSPQ